MSEIIRESYRLKAGYGALSIILTDYKAGCFHELYLDLRSLVMERTSKDFIATFDFMEMTKNKKLLHNEDISYLMIIAKLAVKENLTHLTIVPNQPSYMKDIVERITSIIGFDLISYADE